MSLRVIRDVPFGVDIVGHPRPVPTYLDGSILAGLPVSIVGVELVTIGIGNVPSERHKHEETEVYLLPADRSGEPARIEVWSEESGTQIVEAPALVVIPAGELHQLRVLAARPGQMIFGIFAHGHTGDGTALPQS